MRVSGLGHRDLSQLFGVQDLPMVSIVIPFLGYFIGSYIAKLDKPKTGTAMEAVGMFEDGG